MNDDGGIERRAVDASPADESRARRHGLVGPSQHPVGLARKNERAELGLGKEWITDLQGCYPGGEAVEKRTLEIRMHINPLNRHADLAGMIIAPLDQRLDQAVEVGIAVDDHRRGAAVLQGTARPRRQLGAKMPADTART